MIKIKNKDIHNYLFCKDIERNYSERVKKYPPLTQEQFFLLFLTFEKFIKDERNANNLKMIFDEKQKHLEFAQTVFSYATLPDYTNDDFWNLLFDAYHSEEKFFGMGENISEETYKDNRTLFEILYLFNISFFHPRARYIENKENESVVLSIWREVTDDLCCYMEEKAFRFRLEQEVDLRLGRSPICYNLFYFIRAKDIRESRTNFNSLKNMSAAKIKDLFLPPDNIEFYYQVEKDTPFLNTQEKSAELNMIIAEKAKKIREENPGFALLKKALNKEFCYFTRTVANGFISRLRHYTAEERIPPKGASFTEVPKNLEDPNSTIEIYESASLNSYKKSPIEKHRKQLQSKFGKKGVKMLEIMYKPNMPGRTRITQEEIAEVLNCDVRTVRRYKKKFEKEAEFLFEIFREN